MDSRSRTKRALAATMIAALVLAGGVAAAQPAGGGGGDQPKPRGGGSAAPNSGSTASPQGPGAQPPSGGGGTPAQTPPGQAAFRAPTIIALLQAGRGEFLTGSMSPELKTHFNFYLRAFALSTHQTCPMLSQDAVGKIEENIKRVVAAANQASGREKEELQSFLRSIQFGLNDGKLFVARNACNTEAVQAASKNLLAIL